MMRVTLNLSPETEQRLKELAAHRGQTLEAYLERIAEETAKYSTPPPPQLSAEQWIAELRAWAASHPPLPTIADDSRESIYEGRGE
jgi:predicted transcriptional regulator